MTDGCAILICDVEVDDGATVDVVVFIVADVLVCGALLRSWLCMCELIHHKNKKRMLGKGLKD